MGEHTKIANMIKISSLPSSKIAVYCESSVTNKMDYEKGSVFCWFTLPGTIKGGRIVIPIVMFP